MLFIVCFLSVTFDVRTLYVAAIVPDLHSGWRRHVRNLASATYRRFPVDNASLTILRCGTFGKLIRFNDTTHLATEDLADPGE